MKILGDRVMGSSNIPGGVLSVFITEGNVELQLEIWESKDPVHRVP